MSTSNGKDTPLPHRYSTHHATHAAAMQPLIAPATTVLVLAIGSETVATQHESGLLTEVEVLY